MKRGVIAGLLGVFLGAIAAQASVELPDLTGSVFPVEITEWCLPSSRTSLPSGLRVLLDEPRTTAVLSGFVHLGLDGYIVARMKLPFCAGPGADIRIYEHGGPWGSPPGEALSVYVSMDGSEWEWVGFGFVPANLPYRAFELGDRTNSYLYIKAVARGGRDGPELIAIEALHPRETE